MKANKVSLNNEVLIDLTQDTATEEDVAIGKTFHKADGSICTGVAKIGTVVENDVNFYDYDGTLLYSYTVDEIQAMYELPPLPEHEGLICQGWNWTLEELKAENGWMDVGAMYITDDGKTRLYISIESPHRMDVPLYFRQTVANGVVVDWGDGSPTETTHYTTASLVHAYQSVGDYVISLEVVSGELKLGYGYSSYGAIGKIDAITYKENIYRTLLTKVELGNGVTDLPNYSFDQAANISAITIPNTVKTVQQYAFITCGKFIVLPNGIEFESGASIVIQEQRLIGISLPNGIKTIPSMCFYNCVSLKRLCIPNSVTSYGSSFISFNSPYMPTIKKIKLSSSATQLDNNFLKQANSIEEVIIPNTITSIGANAFSSFYSLKKIKIPDAATTIGAAAFSMCWLLTDVDIPKGVMTIAQQTFIGCGSVKYYNFINHTAVPTLENTNAFNLNADDFVIRVPAALYDEWIAATNWTTYASHIVAV